ncbi:unnamed protein product [Lactuca virosa]|uniref:Plastid division protein CDP1-like 1st alpha solenoid domain-containing protein n=1 Tax=Lactuca virosa TaxID=75947 RepID=A0AAU9P1P7_9ASTR|nr:unnamed protein product [Lactuca virosa]
MERTATPCCIHLPLSIVGMHLSFYVTTFGKIVRKSIALRNWGQTNNADPNDLTATTLSCSPPPLTATYVFPSTSTKCSARSLTSSETELEYVMKLVVLAMAQSYVEISRDTMTLCPPYYIKGCELMETVLKLLQEEGTSSLAPDLQAQIDEALEEINFRNVIKLLALPLDGEHRTRRTEGLQGVHNIYGQLEEVVSLAVLHMKIS